MHTPNMACLLTDVRQSLASSLSSEGQIGSMASTSPDHLLSSLPPLMISAISPQSVAFNSSSASDTILTSADPNCIAKIPCQDIYENETSSNTPVSEDQSHLPAKTPQATNSVPTQSGIQFVNLPFETHEIILNHIFGERPSAGKHTAYGESSTQNWIKALHHPRRKALSNLALTCRLWTVLVQGRIYRHSKFHFTNLNFRGPVLTINYLYSQDQGQ
jgi:hypothetical protein